MSTIYGQSTKESYRNDIEISRSVYPVYKIYEWLDDHTYCSSTAMGINISKDDDNETFLYLFQDDGPRDINTLAKFLEWRKSGKSNEIGHKGGGNKRNIYGHECAEAIIFMKIDEKHALKCSTKPNAILELSKSDINEGDFRNIIDTSKYKMDPEKNKIKDLPSWYTSLFEKLKEESGIDPNFLIRLELSDIPEQYKNKDSFTEFVNQIRAKRYRIPIKFKNELIGMNQYEQYSNIDLIGLEDPNKSKDIEEDLYYNLSNKKHYFNQNGIYIDVTGGKQKINEEDIVPWGKIRMFISSDNYIQSELKKYNNGNPNKKNQEDFYGVYLLINGKQTNYLPFDGKSLGDGKNNKIMEGKNKNTFRMIFIPDQKYCINSETFNSLIITNDVKALTNFLENSPKGNITKYAMKLYKGECLTKSIKKKREKKVKIDKMKTGGIYLIYLGNGLCKLGMVTNYSNMDNRMKEHKSICIEKIKEYSSLLSKKQLPKYPNIMIVYEKETSNPRGDEESLMKIIESNKSDKIKTIQSSRSENELNEYFICDDFDYIQSNIYSLVKEYFE